MSKKTESEQLAREVKGFQKHNKIKKLRTVSHKKVVRKAYTMGLNACPECSSRLIVSSSGVIECSQDKLKNYYQKCLEYEKADNKRKTEILKDTKFLPLYERWQHKDVNGNRTHFECLYSNKLHSPIPEFKVYLIDPIQRKRLEKALGRALFAAELEGQVKCRYKSPKGVWIEEWVERILFPYGLMS